MREAARWLLCVRDVAYPCRKRGLRRGRVLGKEYCIQRCLGPTLTVSVAPTPLLMASPEVVDLPEAGGFELSMAAYRFGALENTLLQLGESGLMSMIG